MQRARRTQRAEFGKYGNSKNKQILCIYEPIMTGYGGQMAMCQACHVYFNAYYTNHITQEETEFRKLN